MKYEGTIACLGQTRRSAPTRSWRAKKTFHATSLRYTQSGVEMSRRLEGVCNTPLQSHAIINMNGRIYDPITAQFMQADNFIQTPEDYIGYNRYAYCRYNPFKFVDPSGEWLMTHFGEEGGHDFDWIVGQYSSGTSSNAMEEEYDYIMTSTSKNFVDGTTRKSKKIGRGTKSDIGNQLKSKDKDNSGKGGAINFFTAYFHYKFGGGLPYYVDISKLDWSMLSEKDFPEGAGSVKSIKLFSLSKDYLASWLFGEITIKYEGNNEISIPHSDKFNFDVRWNELMHGVNVERNIVTGIGGMLLDAPWCLPQVDPFLFYFTVGGTAFDYYFTGIGKIGGKR